MNNGLMEQLRYLRLGNLLTNWDEYLKLAEKRNFSNTRLLQHIIDAEYMARKENARVYRVKRAKIEEMFVMETYPFQRQPKLKKKRVIEIYDAFDYMRKQQNIVWIGPPGCGKTGLATSFLMHAINQGYTGRFVMFPVLIDELYRSIADHSEEKVIKKYAAYECLVIDEIGYVEIESAQVGLFFRLMQKRHRKATSIITTNLGFSEWPSFLKNKHLTAALIDRLTQNSHVIHMKGCRSLRGEYSAIEREKTNGSKSGKTNVTK